MYNGDDDGGNDGGDDDDIVDDENDGIIIVIRIEKGPIFSFDGTADDDDGGGDFCDHCNKIGKNFELCNRHNFSSLSHERDDFDK